MKSVIILGERLFVFFPFSFSLKMISVPVGPAVVHSHSHHNITSSSLTIKSPLGYTDSSNEGERDGGNIGTF
jgi:hypothetical protein